MSDKMCDYIKTRFFDCIENKTIKQVTIKVNGIDL